MIHPQLSAHLAVAAAASVDSLGVDTCVDDSHQASCDWSMGVNTGLWLAVHLLLTAPDLAFGHVQEEAELAVLAPSVAAAAPGHRLSDVSLRMRSPRGRPSGQQPIIRCQGRAVGRVPAAVEAGAGGGTEEGGVDHQQITRGTREHQLRAVTSWG